MAQSSSKSPELLARYCDSLLKKRYVFEDELLFQVGFCFKMIYTVKFYFVYSEREHNIWRKINYINSWI